MLEPLLRIEVPEIDPKREETQTMQESSMLKNNISVGMKDMLYRKVNTGDGQSRAYEESWQLLLCRF